MPFQPEEKYVWDLWFAHDGKEQHLFYLQADREACDFDHHKRHNLSSVGHALIKDGQICDASKGSVFSASTTDDTWDNFSIWTGSIIKDPDSRKFLMFYTARKREDIAIETPSEFQRPQNIGLAVSDDLVNWKRHPNSVSSPVIANPGTSDHFDGVAWRDPYVFKLGDYFYCLITARLEPNEKYNIGDWDQGGTIAWLRSKDLYDWSAATPQILVTSRHFYELEVPQLFSHEIEGKRVYYLIFCAQRKACSKERLEQLPDSENQSGTYLFTSEPMELESLELPRFESPAKLLTPGLYAGKILNPESTSPTIYGFHIGTDEESQCGGILSATLDKGVLSAHINT